MDLIIDEPIVVEFVVENTFPATLPVIFIRDTSQFDRQNIEIVNDILTLNWMDKAKCNPSQTFSPPALKSSSH